MQNGGLRYGVVPVVPPGHDQGIQEFSPERAVETLSPTFVLQGGKPGPDGTEAEQTEKDGERTDQD
jgi:hypothetical protein